MNPTVFIDLLYKNIYDNSYIRNKGKHNMVTTKQNEHT